MKQTWRQLGIVSKIDGPALGNSITATSLLNGVEKYIIPAGYLEVGSKVRISAQGRVSNIVTTPGTLTLSVRTVGGIVLANGGAIALNVAAKTNVAWWLDMIMTCRAIGSGAGANFMFQGEWTSESMVGAAAGEARTAMLPPSTPAVGAGFDSSAAQQIDLFGAWSIANAGNTIQVHQYEFELSN